MLDSYRKRIVLEVARGVVLISLFLSGQTYAQETEIQITCPDSAATESEQSSPVLRQGIQQQLAQIRTCLGTGDMDCAERGLEELEDADLRDDEPAAWFVACQFHPEFTSRPRGGHPLFTGYIAAALKRAGSRIAADA